MIKLRVINKECLVYIKSKKYGEIPIYLSEKTRIGDGYIAIINKDGKNLTGYVDYEGVEVIPFSEMNLDNYFFTKNYEDICFGFEVPDTEVLKYFHVKKKENHSYRLVMATKPDDEHPIIIHPIKEHLNIWTLEVITLEQSAIYSPKEEKILTPFFDELSFDIDENPYGHFAYFCDYVYSERNYTNDDGSKNVEKVNHTSVCGFLDKNGNFSSKLLETEGETYWDSYLFDNTPNSIKYQKFLLTLENKYQQEYDSKESRIDEEISYLFNHFNESIKPKNNCDNKQAKIIKFQSKL